MAEITADFLKNPLRIGLFIRSDNEKEIFFGSVCKNIKGQMVYNSSIEWNSNWTNRLEGFIVDFGGNIMTHIVKEDLTDDYEGTPPKSIFSHLFLVPYVDIVTLDKKATFLDFELVQSNFQAEIVENPIYEILQRDLFNVHETESSNSGILVTHKRLHS